MVMDNGVPQLSSTTRVVVAVEDVNDHSPEFDQKFYKVQIPATAVLDQALFQVCVIHSAQQSIINSQVSLIDIIIPSTLQTIYIRYTICLLVIICILLFSEIFLN